MTIMHDVSECFGGLKSGMSVFVHGGAATPHALIDGMVQSAVGKLTNIEVIHLHTHGQCGYAAHPETFRVSNLFVGKNMRSKINYESIDYLPVFLSEAGMLFRSRRKALDLALVQVSPPDQHGFCSLGTSVDIVLAAVQSATTVIAQINPQMPRVLGDGFVHISQFQSAIEVNCPIDCFESRSLSEDELKIGRHIAGMVEDGSTLQTGIGAIPDAVLFALNGSHKNLGVHTEMWSDGLLPLIEKGIVNNSMKKVHPGKTVSSFVVGSQALYDKIHNNPSFVQLEASYVNHIGVISRNPKVIAINSAVALDLTGQVCADSVGSRVISGVGGQVDFIKGAALSEGGKPIIAMLSRTKSGQSKFSAQLKAGSGVVTTRAHVHYVATEFGIVDLFGSTLNERAKKLISISHPDDREGLDRGWSEVKKNLHY